MTDQQPTPVTPGDAGVLADLGTAPVVAAAPRRSKRRLALASVLAVAAVGAGAYGITTMSGTDDGAASPDAAVERFLDAVDQEDVIGVLESVEPGERTALRRAVDGVLATTERAGVTDDVDLGKVRGVDLKVEGVAKHTTDLADDVAAVDLTAGRVTGDASLTDLPIGATLRQVLQDHDTTKVDDDAIDIDLADLRLMTIRTNGRWYVSPLYTGAEAIRRDADPEQAVPKFDGGGITPKGADSPEAAVQALVAATQELDVPAMIATTSPSRARVLYDYAPLLRSEATGEPSFTITDLQLATTDGPDGSKIVTTDRYTLSDDSDDDRYRVEWDGRCSITTVTYHDSIVQYDENGPVEGTESESGEPQTQTFNSCDDQTTKGPFGLLFLLPTSGGALRVSTVEEDGRWYVDPLDSITSTLVGSFDDMPTADLKRMVLMWSGAWWLAESDELWKACGVTKPADDAPIDEGMAALDDCYDHLPDDYAGPIGYWGDTGREYSDSFGGPDDPYGGCYDHVDDDATMEACLLTGVADGTVDPRALAEFQCSKLAPVDPEAPDDDPAWKAYEACYTAIDWSTPWTPKGADGPSSTSMPASPTTTVIAAPPTTTSVVTTPTTIAGPATSVTAATTPPTTVASATTTAPATTTSVAAPAN
jgi:hypothetical protein